MKTRFLTGLLALGWITAILIAYYAGHKPFTPALALALGLAAWRLASAVLLVSLAGAIGVRLFQRAPDETWSPLSLLAVQAALGLGLMGLGVLLLGLTVGLPRWLLVGLPILLLALLRRPALTWWRHWRSLPALFKESGAFGRWAAVLLAAALSSSLLVALAPPAAYDSLVYHLVIPDAYLRAGRIIYLPWLIMTGLPQAAEMLSTLAMAWSGAAGAAVLGWTVGPLAAVGLLGYLRSRFNLPAAWAGLAALLAGYSTTLALAWGYVDWLGLLFGLGCFLLLDSYRQCGRRSDAAWAGVFAGMAFGAKYTAGILAIAGGLALLWHIWRRRDLLVPVALRFGLLAIALMLPWLLKNLIMTGNPLYPFFFPAGAVSPARLPIFQNSPTWGDWRDIVFLPFTATYLGVDGSAGYDWSVGPLLLGLGGLAWIGFRKLKPAQRASFEHITLLAGLTWLIWAIGNQRSGYLIQTRMYFPLFPALAALAALGFHGLEHLSEGQTPGNGVRFARIASALVLLVLGFNLLQSVNNVVSRGVPQALLARQSEQEYLTNVLGWYLPASQALRELPPGSQTLLLYEPRSLYCQPACRPDEILDRWKRDWALYQGDPQAIIQAWRAEGFTDLLLSRSGAEFFRANPDSYHSPQDIAELDAFLAQLPAPQNFGGAYELYPLK